MWYIRPGAMYAVLVDASGRAGFLSVRPSGVLLSIAYSNRPGGTRVCENTVSREAQSTEVSGVDIADMDM